MEKAFFGGSFEGLDSRFFDTLPVAVYVCGRDGRIVRFNPRAVEIWGREPRAGERFSAAARLRRRDGSVVPKESGPLAHVLRTGETLEDEEYVIEREDASQVAVRATIVPLKDARGDVVGAINTFQDITLQKGAAADRARLAAIIDSSDDAIVGKTLDGVITSWNFGAEQVFGYPAAEAIGQHISFIIPADRRSEEDEVLARLRRGEKIDHFETVRQTKDGRLIDVSLTVSPIRDADGQIIGASKVGRDITVRKRAEEALSALALDNARLYQHAQEVNRTKDEFLATLSHELRTPLNAVLGWSHLLQSNALPPEMQRRALEAIERNAKAQAQLVDDLLDVSRIVSGRLQMKLVEVDLAGVVAAAIETIRPTAVAKSVELVVFTPPESRVIVMGDADRLRQIFWNLLSNAVKFTPRGGRIRVELRHHGHTAEVVVRDSGQGISPDFLPHVFERFRQADSAVSRKHGGLGLGLAIVRHLTEAHGGTVAAESPGDDLGATFRVTLPLHALRDRAELPARQHAKTTTLAGLRLLVVDDEPDAHELMRALLESHGAEVVSAASAGEALAFLVHRKFDVVLSDLGMPNQDGYSLIQAVRALPAPENRQVPAIAVTAYAGIRERARALAAGYGWHLTKPIDVEQLVATVSTAARSA